MQPGLQPGRRIRFNNRDMFSSPDFVNCMPKAKKFTRYHYFKNTTLTAGSL